MLELFNQTYVMPDQTTRAALIVRLADKIRPVAPDGGWKALDDFNNEAYWELSIIFVANVTAWMAAKRPQGIIIRKTGAAWTISDVQTASVFTKPTLPQAVILAAHTLCDLVGA